MDKDTFLHKAARITTWYNRGGSLVGFVIETIQNFALVGLAIDVANRLLSSIWEMVNANFHTSITIYFPLWAIPLLAFLKPIIQMIIGYWDTKFGFYQAEREYYSSDINPYSQRMEKKTDKIITLLENAGKERENSNQPQ